MIGDHLPNRQGISMLLKLHLSGSKYFENARGANQNPDLNLSGSLWHTWCLPAVVGIACAFFTKNIQSSSKVRTPYF